MYIEVLNRMIKIYSKEGNFEYRGTLKEIMDNLEKQLFVQCHRSYVVNIIYIKEIGNKDIIMKDGSIVPISSLKEIMDNLEKQLFVQCHRSYVVNIIYIKEIGNKDIIMKDGSIVPISRKI